MNKQALSDLSQAVQDYLKIIYKLQENGPVATTEIAKELEVSGASVTGMLKRLDAMGFVEYNSYKGVRLSDQGEKYALEILRLHRLLELYLKEKMGYSLDKVHDEACRLEHHISEEFSDKIDEMLGNPVFDPHGHPIPTKDGKILSLEEVKLCQLEPPVKVKISRIGDDDVKLLAYLEEMGLVPNVDLELLEKEPFNGPIKIKFKDKEKIIGCEIASNIFVVKL
jgi:DtxR family Mn-dependent transcriptional regulator